MDTEAYDKLIANLTQQRYKLAQGKRHDYANEDVISNFKRMGLAAKTLQLPQLWERYPSFADALFLALMKLDRIVNVMLKDKVVNESVEDSFMDLLNYIELAYATIKEGQQTQPKV